MRTSHSKSEDLQQTRQNDNSTKHQQHHHQQQEEEQEMSLLNKSSTPDKNSSGYSSESSPLVKNANNIKEVRHVTDDSKGSSGVLAVAPPVSSCKLLMCSGGVDRLVSVWGFEE